MPADALDSLLTTKCEALVEPRGIAEARDQREAGRVLYPQLFQCSQET